MSSRTVPVFLMFGFCIILISRDSSTETSHLFSNVALVTFVQCLDRRKRKCCLFLLQAEQSLTRVPPQGVKTGKAVVGEFTVFLAEMVKICVKIMKLNSIEIMKKRQQ